MSLTQTQIQIQIDDEATWSPTAPTHPCASCRKPIRGGKKLCQVCSRKRRKGQIGPPKEQADTEASKPKRSRRSKKPLEPTPLESTPVSILPVLQGEVLSDKQGSSSGANNGRTPENLRLLCSEIARGVPLPHACALIRMTYAGMRQWRQSDPNVDLAIEQAEARATSYHVDVIQAAAAEGAWAASAWWLERRRPQWYGKTQTIILQVGEVVDETRRLAIEAGVDPDIAEEEARKLLQEGSQK